MMGTTGLGVIMALCVLGAPVELSGPRTELTLDLDHPAILTSIRDVPTGQEFLNADSLEAALFMIHFLGPDGRPRYVSGRGRHPRELRTEADGALNVICDYPEMDVRVRVRFTGPDEQGLIHAGIGVRNGTDMPITRIDFPYLPLRPQLGASAADDRMFWPCSFGRVLSRLGELGSRSYEYPGPASMQCWGYYDDTAGLYVAAQDGMGHAKEFGYWTHKMDGVPQAFIASERRQRGEMPGADYGSEYDCVIGTFQGDWQDIAAIYKPWALKQMWMPPRLSERRDIPQWVKEPFAANGVWIKRAQSPEPGRPIPVTPLAEVPRIAREYAAVAGLPLVMFVGGWEKHGTCMTPDLLPPAQGEAAMRRACAEMRADGNRFFIFHPGIKWTLEHSTQGYDGRAYFEREGEPYAVKNRDGTVWARGTSGESFDGRYADLCISTPKVHQTMAGIVAQVAGIGVDVAAYDQFVGGKHPPCYDPTHGHPLGRGQWVYDSTRYVFQETRRRAKAVNPDFALMLEWPSELYLGCLDIMTQEYETVSTQRGRPGYDEPVPALGFVYHEYSPTFCFTALIKNWRQPWLMPVEQAVALVNGWIPYPYCPIEGPGACDPQGLAMWAKCSQALATYARPYCYFGEMLKAPPLDVPTFSRRAWHQGTRQMQELVLPAILHSAWRAADGSIGVSLIGVAEGSGTANLRLPCYFEGPCRLQLLRDGAPEWQRDVDALPAEVPLRVGQYDICLLTVRPLGSQE
jgi:hypothetical protein